MTYSPAPDDGKLRKRLETITGMRSDKQLTAIEKLRAEFSHSIVLREKANSTRIPFNCYEYAFNIACTPPVNIISTEGDAKQNEKLAVTTDFVSELIGEVLIEREPCNATDGDIIIYFDNNTPTHAGKFYKGRVVSKWGNGHLWEHVIYEVPLRYGDRIKFFLPVDRDGILKRFIQYAKAHGSNYED